MEVQKVREVLQKYIKELEREPSLRPERHPPDQPLSHRAGTGYIAAMRHLHWMALEASAFPDEKVEKMMRWLGFIQGVMWVFRATPVQNFKIDNKPKAERKLCKQCRKHPVCYEGADFCGAGCTARHEAHEPPAEEEDSGVRQTVPDTGTTS